MHRHFVIFVIIVMGLVLSGLTLVMAANPDFVVSNKTLEIDPFTITETTYLRESSISDEKCQQKINLMNDTRCQPASGYKPDPEAVQRCKLLKPQEGLICKCKVQVTYPQFASAEYDKTILDKINLELKTRAEKFKDKYASTLSDCMPSMAANEYSLAYNLEFKGKYDGVYQLYQNGKVLTVQYNNSIPSEMHPIYANNFFNFDLSTGKLLTFGDVIKKSSLAAQYDSIWKFLTNDPSTYYFNNPATSYDQAKAALKSIYKIENFYFGQRKLIVYFSPLEIGPWSSGDFVFQINSDHIDKKFL